MRRPAGRLDAGGDDRVPKPGAIEMGAKSVFTCPAANCFDTRKGLDLPAATVVGVLECHQPGADVMRVGGANEIGQLLDLEHTVAARNRPSRNTAELRVARLLVVVDVATRFANQFVAGSAVQPHADQVRHCAGWNEQRRLHTENLSHPLLETVDGRIVGEDIIAHSRVGHSGAHTGRGTRNSVAAKIENVWHGIGR